MATSTTSSPAGSPHRSEALCRTHSSWRGLMVAVIFILSGCYLSWPDRQANDGGPLEASAGDGAADQSGVDSMGQECQGPADCSDRAAPECTGSWDCLGGYCAFLCEDCEDQDRDSHGVGEGCAGPDCDDQDSTVYVGAPEICDKKDNNCDGQEDEGLGVLVCGAGICKVSMKACFAGERQSCEPKVGTEEFCAGVIAVDENCDTKIDEFCPCADGDVQACYSGPVEEAWVGECWPGNQTCKDQQWGTCDGEVTPVAEQCDGLDNDCDNLTDEDLERPPCELTQGVCLVARATECQGTAGWAACTEVHYGPDFELEESRCDGLDNDCDGAVDEQCPCFPDGWTRLCGPAHGTCKQGSQRCSDGVWGMCLGSATAGAEICDGVDNDCDGLVDEDFDQDQDTYTPCGTKPGGGLDPALRDCDDLKASHRPGAQELCDTLDNDCDGLVDEALVAAAPGADGGVGAGDGGLDGGVDSGAAGKEVAYGVCACNNGLDDDGDGLADSADPGCASLGDNYERGSAACDDTRDNDGDGVSDYPLDPGCTGPGDTDERGAGACDDGVDNDGDGLVDHRKDGFGDPGCASPGDASEQGAGACDDGVDNDGDGKVDYKVNGSGDPGCSAVSDPDEVGTAVCDDGVDNDGDGAADYKTDGSGDPGCAGLDDLSEEGDGPCDDGMDNDGDGAVDYKSDGSGDPGCDAPGDLSERGASACDDGMDNDGDGVADYRSDGTGDPGCAGPDDPSEWGSLECDDGLDNDSDGATDFKANGTGDSSCAGPSDSSEFGNSACDDGADNDGDGTVDYRSDGTGDPGCGDLLDSSERGTGICDDGLDNDGDGTADYRTDGAGDPGCGDVTDASELGAAVCDDGLDNDGDGTADFKSDGTGDPGCADLADASELGAGICDDGLDNDGDGSADYKIDGSGDPGCAAVNDADELGAGACDDGLDNDGDGVADFNDPGCAGPADPSESGAAACDDGVDNDGDGTIDFKIDGSGDEGCLGPDDTREDCAAHAECPSGVCTISGDCAAEASVSYVDAGACASGAQNGGAADPFCTLREAVEGTQPVIKLAAGTYIEQLDITRDVEIYGAPGAVVLDVDANCSAIKVNGGAEVVLSGITVGSGANREGGIVVDDSGTTLTLIQNEVGPSLCVGVEAKGDTTINLERNYIHHNQGGGAELDRVKTFLIQNNIVVHNGTINTSFGGFSLAVDEPSLFINNTVADNRSRGDSADKPGGVLCWTTSTVPTIALVNSILWGNTAESTFEQQYHQKCVPAYCILESPTAVPATNSSDDPAFVAGGASGADYYHLQGTSGCINGGTATDAPADDYDGEARDAQPDIGADEVL